MNRVVDGILRRNRTAPRVIAKINGRATNPKWILARRARLRMRGGDIVLQHIPFGKRELETIVGRRRAVIAHKAIVVRIQTAFAAQIITVARVFAVIVRNQILVALQTDPARRFAAVFKFVTVRCGAAVIVAVEMISNEYGIAAANVERTPPIQIAQIVSDEGVVHSVHTRDANCAAAYG